MAPLGGEGGSAAAVVLSKWILHYRDELVEETKRTKMGRRSSSPIEFEG